MKKHIIIGIAVTACVALCAAVWPPSAEDGKVPAEPVQPAVIAEIGTKPEETSKILFSADSHTPKLEYVEESEPSNTDITTEEKIEAVPSATPKPTSTPAQPSSEPKSGDRVIIDGKPYIWIPGFGWIEDYGGGSVGIPVDGEGDINKQVGVMGGGTTVGNPSDELTGNKVGVMGGNSGTFAANMYENGHKIGSMRGEDVPARESIPEPSVLPEPTGDEIHIVLIEVPDKNSTLPPDKPGTTPPTDLVP